MVGIDETTVDRRHPNGRKKKRDLLHSLEGQRVMIVSNSGTYSGTLNPTQDGKIFVDDSQLSIAQVKRIHPYIPQIDLYAGVSR